MALGKIFQSPEPEKRQLVKKEVPKPKYQATVSPEDRLIVDVDDYRISSIFDTYAFKESLEYFPNWISQPNLDIAVKFEESVQRALKTLSPRRYSGLHPYSHIVGDFEEAHTLSKMANAPLDFVTFVGILGHDIVEDNEEMIALNKKYEEALNSRDHKSRQDLERIIANTRVQKIDRLEKELVGYIPPSPYLKGGQRDDLEGDLRITVKLISDVTRWSNELPYALSMGHQYRRKDDESLSQTFRKMSIKNPDRIRNMKETGPMVDLNTMLRIESAFNDNKTIVGDYNVGEELRNRYGKVRTSGVDMPLAVRVGTGVNSIYPLHYANETFNMYSRDVFQSSDDRKKQLLRLAMVGAHEMAAVTLKLMGSAIASYEIDGEVKAAKPEIDDIISMKKASTFYDRVTLNGVIKDWLLYDGGGREFVESLDKNPGDRVKTYTAARHMMEVIPRFVKFYDPDVKGSDEKPVLVDDHRLYDPKRHTYFTLGGIDDIMKLLPDYWELVAEFMRHKHDSKKGGSLKYLML